MMMLRSGKNAFTGNGPCRAIALINFPYDVPIKDQYSPKKQSLDRIALRFNPDTKSNLTPRFYVNRPLDRPTEQTLSTNPHKYIDNINTEQGYMNRNSDRSSIAGLGQWWLYIVQTTCFWLVEFQFEFHIPRRISTI